MCVIGYCVCMLLLDEFSNGRIEVYGDNKEFYIKSQTSAT